MVDDTGAYETTGYDDDSVEYNDDGVGDEDDGIDYPEDDEMPDYTEENAVPEDDSDGVATALLWFSVAGAVIMGLLWIIGTTGVFGLTWTVLGPTTTLAIGVVAAIGAALSWYSETSDTTDATA